MLYIVISVYTCIVTYSLYSTLLLLYIYFTTILSCGCAYIHRLSLLLIYTFMNIYSYSNTYTCTDDDFISSNGYADLKQEIDLILTNDSGASTSELSSDLNFDSLWELRNSGTVIWRGSRHVGYTRDIPRNNTNNNNSDNMTKESLINYFCTDYSCIYNTTLNEPILHVRDEAVLLSSYLCPRPEPEIVGTEPEISYITRPTTSGEVSGVGELTYVAEYTHPALYNTIHALKLTSSSPSATAVERADLCFINASYAYLSKAELLQYR